MAKSDYLANKSIAKPDRPAWTSPTPKPRRWSYAFPTPLLMRRFTRPPKLACTTRNDQENPMSDLNDASKTTPPKDVKARLEKSEEASRKLDSPARTNDSTIDPDKPAKDILEGYHGG